MKISRTNLLAGLWGIAEASIFFIVPDVLLSWIALRSYRRALVACLWVLGGALAGACVVWYFGHMNPAPARVMFEGLPAINVDMIADVQSQLEGRGLWSLFIGPLTGTPYKIYALEAANLRFGLFTFLLISIPARLLRFLLVSVVAGALSQLLQRFVKLYHVQLLHMLCWTAFYSWFFYVMAK